LLSRQFVTVTGTGKVITYFFIISSFSGDVVLRKVVLKLPGCRLDWFLGYTTMLLALNDYLS